MSTINSLSNSYSSYLTTLGSSFSNKITDTSNQNISQNNDSTSGLKSTLSFADLDNDGMFSISDLNTRLDKLYEKQKTNKDAGITDKNLNEEIQSTQQLINDFQNWSKKVDSNSSGTSSSSLNLSENFIKMLSKAYSNKSGLLVDTDA